MMTPATDPRETARRGELTVLGRIRSASNATFLCEATLGTTSVHCVYKPVAGEQPLWDFPDGTLAGRELGAYLVAQQLGWNIVPYTTIRDGPAGVGMVQLWVDQQEHRDSELDLVDVVPTGAVPPGYLPVLDASDYAGDRVTLVHADDPRLHRMAVFDVLINNADRKGGHILAGVDGGVYGIDHGLCLHVEDKLRTVLWGWSGHPINRGAPEAPESPQAQKAPYADGTLAAVGRLVDALGGPLAEALTGHITTAEILALRRRACALLDTPVMPSADRHRPIPWPAF